MVLLALAEGLVRLTGFASSHVPDRIYRPFDAEIPYVPKANLRAARGWSNTRFDTDARGLRVNPDAPEEPGTYRVALAGDSVTFGDGVASDETFAHHLQRALGSTGARVFNFGVSGYSVREIAATVERRVGTVAPDLVVITIIPADFELARTGTLDAWGSVRPTGGSDALEWLKVPLRRLHLPYALLDVVRGRRAQWMSVPIVAVPRSYDYVAGLHATCAARGFACGLVLLSTTIDDGFGPIGDALRTQGLPMLDLTHLKDAFTKETFDVGPYDPHPSAAVHRGIAEALAPWIAGLRDRGA